MRLEFIGPPGAGKGTQAQRVSNALGVPHISTGDMFRDNVKRRTSIGEAASAIMRRGELVPDELVARMVDERLDRDDCRDGYLLDGFPRTTGQLQALDGFLDRRGWSRSAVVLLVVPDEVLVARISGRRTCESCGTVTRAGKEGSICDNCRAKLVQRPDDTEDVVRERLRLYRLETAPLLQTYRDRSLLVEVDGTGNEDEVYAAVMGVLKEAAA